MDVNGIDKNESYERAEKEWKAIQFLIVAFYWHSLL